MAEAAVTEATVSVGGVGGGSYSIPAPAPLGPKPLKFRIRAAPLGSESKVVLVTPTGEFDLSPWLRELLVHTSVERATELTLVFVDVDVDIEAEPGVLSADGEMPAELASVLLPEKLEP
jgi:hypothetical protein